MADRIRVGLIGAGWGSIVHGPAFQLVPEYDLVALCSRRPGPLAKAAERLGVTDTSTDWQSFVRRDDLDLISISAPVGFHHDMTMAALEAGKHVLCEKPAALSADQAQAMAEEAERRGVVNGICFEMRWGCDNLPIWQMIRAGFLGKPYYYRQIASAGYWHPTHAPQAEWMYKRAEGGGYLNGQLSHSIDFASLLFGTPTAVCAEVRTSLPAREMPDGRTITVDADDTTTLLLRMDSGASVVLSVSVMGAHTAGGRTDMFGSDGTLIMDGYGGGQEIRAGKATDRELAVVPPSTREPRSGLPVPARRAGGAIRSQALMLEDWLPAFDGKPTQVPTLRDGWRVQHVIEQAQASAEGAGWVELDSI